MKKLMILAVGLGLALGTVSFAQDSTASTDKKTDTTKKTKKSKKTKKPATDADASKSKM